MDTTISACDACPDVLLDRLKSGDERALAELFSRYRERLHRAVRFRLDRRLPGRVDADDVLQEAYLAAAQRVGHFLEKPAMSLFVWLRLIVGQTLIDVHRRHLGAQMRDADRDVSLHVGGRARSSSGSLAGNLIDSRTSPSRAAMRKERSQQLEAVLAAMSRVDREVLTLRHFEELTNREVAEYLGIGQKAASIRYVRAVKRLKDAITNLSTFSEYVYG
ncbi:MAG: sigma-70 family RNA polymerase sigma factor [Planctomycetota bacterium]|jgi:RNA polymerase sigma-70 factor (ECF subfamily)